MFYIYSSLTLYQDNNFPPCSYYTPPVPVWHWYVAPADTLQEPGPCRDRHNQHRSRGNLSHHKRCIDRWCSYWYRRRCRFDRQDRDNIWLRTVCE